MWPNWGSRYTTDGSDVAAAGKRYYDDNRPMIVPPPAGSAPMVLQVSHSVTRSRLKSPTHSPTLSRSLTRPPTNPLTHPLTHSFAVSINAAAGSGPVLQAVATLPHYVASAVAFKSVQLLMVPTIEVVQVQYLP